MSPKKDAANAAAADKTPRTLTSGVVIGRAVEKLQDLDAEEKLALEQSPAQIKARFQTKREEVLAGLTDKQRKAVLGAVAAIREEEDEGPVSN